MQHKAIKKLGQNFLNQPAIAHKIVANLAISENDHVIEIGPGPGVLTEIIANKPKQSYTVIELDKRFTKELSQRYAGKLEVIEHDFLTWPMETILNQKPLKFIGNIPYNITSPILFKLLEHYSALNSAVIMMQKEVAQRIVAREGNKQYGILSILMQTFAEVELLFDVGRNNFTPAPRVDSAVVRFCFNDTVNDIENPKLFRFIVRSVFNYRRKMLRNSLGRLYDPSILETINFIELTRRPETLTIAEFKQLSNHINTLHNVR